MAFMKTNTVDIEVDEKIYNSLRDFGLAIGNTDYLGSPVHDDSNLVFVPGRSAPLNCDKNVFGEPCFSYRKIQIDFGGQHSPEKWDTFISMFRSLFEGREIKLRFLTDPEWYWKGLAKVDSFTRNRSIGTFSLVLPYADAYKNREKTIKITATSQGLTVVFKNEGCKRVVPKVTTSGELLIEYGTKSISMSAGTWINTALMLEPGHNTMVFTGSSADVTVEYTEKSL